MGGAKTQTDQNRTGRTGPEWHPWSRDFPSWIMDHGSKIKDQRSSIKDHGSSIKYQVSSIKDQGSRTLDLGPGMNDHPRSDINVRSRPSESTIKDLSFYIGFIRIQLSNKHVEPCYGMNGHSRRDPDTISRLPDTTSHFLSVFIGFRCSNFILFRGSF